MMESILLLLNSTPTTPNTDRAFATALQLRSLGNKVSLCLIQDAVLAALDTSDKGMNQRTADVLEAGISIYALGEDLALHGITSHKLFEGICSATYSQLIDLFERHTRVIGAL